MNARPHGGYRICTRCIMDTTDPEIYFDDKGVCHRCHDYNRVIRDHVFADDTGKQRWHETAQRIKAEGYGKPYDCVIGLSGGVDSSYVAWLVKNAGLRPLAVHLDNGWNTEVAVRNIENIVKILDIDLHTEVLDWEEFRSLQAAFIRGLGAGLRNPYGPCNRRKPLSGGIAGKGPLHHQPAETSSPS